MSSRKLNINWERERGVTDVLLQSELLSFEFSASAAPKQLFVSLFWVLFHKPTILQMLLAMPPQAILVLYAEMVSGIHNLVQF